MQFMISTGRQSLLAAVLFLVACFSTSSAFAAPTENLNFGQWSLISIPADPGATGTVEALFGDDLPTAEYGSNWLIYAFDSAANEYRLLALDESLEANRGYWIFQRVNDPAEIDVPDSLSALTGSDQVGCPVGQQCAVLPLTSNASFPVWNAVGYSSESQALFGETRFVTASGVCADGCTPTEALSANVAQSVMFSLNSEGTAYEVINEGTPMQPWDGYWLLVLPDADQLRWFVPVDSDPVTPPNPPEQQPELTGPEPGTRLSGPDVTFIWDDNGVTVDQWYLRVGLGERTGEFADVRLTDPSTTEFSVSGLPTNGVPIIVELSYRLDGVWTNLYFEYTSFDDNAVNPDDFALVDDNITGLLGGQPVTGNVATNDTIPSDAAQQGLLLAVTRQPVNGSVSINAVTGAFTYRPDTGFAGDDFFIYSLVQFDDNDNPVSFVASA
ncbi:MAG: Ig-like domain-containing protein, partial [Granulosicoccus sp.]